MKTNCHYDVKPNVWFFFCEWFGGHLCLFRRIRYGRYRDRAYRCLCGYITCQKP